ncbi:MAG: RDD family protein [Firmicutes bacterium]|nr:RDD family protein [Bacillota bacterium]
MFCVSCGKAVATDEIFCTNCGSKIQTGLTSVPSGGAINTQTVAMPVYAGFFSRVAAFLIDSVILSLVFMLLFFVLLGGVTFETSDSSGAHVIFWFMFALMLLYSAFMESSPRQGTLGKMAVGIKVTSLDGGRLSFVNALGRAAMKTLSVVFFCIGCLIAAFTEKHQAFHDFPAGSVVVKKSGTNAGLRTEGFSGAQGQPAAQNQRQTAQIPVPAAEGSMSEDWDIAGAITKTADQNVSHTVKSEFLHGLSAGLNEAGLPADLSKMDVPIKLKGHFILIDEGNRVMRYLSSGMSGKARVEVEGVLLVNDAVAANLHARHEQGIGFYVFGGDNQRMVGMCGKKCGAQIARQVVSFIRAQRQ